MDATDPMPQVEMVELSDGTILARNVYETKRKGLAYVLEILNTRFHEQMLKKYVDPSHSIAERDSRVLKEYGIICDDGQLDPVVLAIIANSKEEFQSGLAWKSPIKGEEGKLLLQEA